ncbi:hypothetical protein SB764_39555, partial [Paraburkholderia sp. SIMBA_027]
SALTTDKAGQGDKKPPSDLELPVALPQKFVLNETTGRYELVPATKSVESLKGLVGKPAKPVSVEDMNAAIAARGAGA